MEILAWLEQTDFSIWMRESDWGDPIMLCVHAVGMAIVVGVSFMFAARVLGFAKDFPLAGFDRLFGLAWIGFIMNAASGVLMFIGEPRRLLATPAFLIKMFLIVCAGFALWMLSKALEGSSGASRRRAPAGTRRHSRRSCRNHASREGCRHSDDRVLARCDPFGSADRLHHRPAAALSLIQP